MIDSAVTDLPLPDSPTSPSVSPARISKLTSSTAGTGPDGRSKTVVRFETESKDSDIVGFGVETLPRRTRRKDTENTDLTKEETVISVRVRDLRGSAFVPLLERTRRKNTEDTDLSNEETVTSVRLRDLRGRAFVQMVTASRYSPKTARMASAISPTVACASTAAMIDGTRLLPSLASSTTLAIAVRHTSALLLARRPRTRATCRCSTSGLTLKMGERTPDSLNLLTPTTTDSPESTARWAR